MSPQLERLLKQSGSDVPEHKRILELNPNHAILAKMQTTFDANEEDPVLVEYAHLLHGQALLAEGSPLPDPVAFGKRVAELMVRN